MRPPRRPAARAAASARRWLAVMPAAPPPPEPPPCRTTPTHSCRGGTDGEGTPCEPQRQAGGSRTVRCLPRNGSVITSGHKHTPTHTSTTRLEQQHGAAGRREQDEADRGLRVAAAGLCPPCSQQGPLQPAALLIPAANGGQHAYSRSSGGGHQSLAAAPPRWWRWRRWRRKLCGRPQKQKLEPERWRFGTAAPPAGGGCQGGRRASVRLWGGLLLQHRLRFSHGFRQKAGALQIEVRDHRRPLHACLPFPPLCSGALWSS